jgi:hypothetical protein
MDRDSRIRAEMKGVYDKICDAAGRLAGARTSVEKFEADVTRAGLGLDEAAAAQAREQTRQTVSLGGFRILQEARQSAAGNLAVIEGWLSASRREVETAAGRLAELEAEYAALGKELDSPGADVVKFPGHDHGDIQ